MLYPPWISWYIFALVLFMIPIDLFISLPGMLRRSIIMLAPPVLDKNDDAAVKLVTVQQKPYPVRCLIAKLHVTGDGFSVICNLRCPPQKDGVKNLPIDTSLSGVTVFELKRLWAVSMLGLFSLPVKANAKKAVLVLPPPVKPVNTALLQQAINLRPKPGGGFSEEHDMRTYRPGEPVRNIHWKASAKLDSLIIREPLVPPPHSRLVHIMPWSSPVECDLILGRVRWISDFLIKWEMPFYVKYSDEITVAEIKYSNDMVDFLCKVLTVQDEKTQKTDRVPSRFSLVYRVDAKGYRDSLKREVEA